MRSKLNYLLSRIGILLRYPLHYVFVYLWVKVLGSLRNKIYYGSFRLPHYAYGVYTAAQRAKAAGIRAITVIEFGVANGRGLTGMAKYAAMASEESGVAIEVLGFDSGEGMPAFEGYKDHPEIYVTGDYPMQQPGKLRAILPTNTKLIILDLNESDWTQHISPTAPVGFISVDVDYYSSTRNILQYLPGMEAGMLLPNTLFYFDDILLDNHNAFQGELLAINEFNQTSAMRKFDSFTARLRFQHFFYNAPWLNQIFQLHILDHPMRKLPYRKEDDPARVLHNKYL